MRSTSAQSRVGVALVLIACGTERESVSPQTRVPVRTAAELVVTSMLQAPEQIVGRRVELTAARALAVSDAALLVGPMRSHSVLVVPVDSRMTRGIDVGDDVMVTGTVKHMPPPTWGFAGRQPEPLIRGARLAGVETYVEAEKLDAGGTPEPDRTPASS